MTHVMEIRRLNITAFPAAEVKPVLSALHVGVSFAFGRCVAPTLPVGQNDQGDVVWGEWGPALCDPARNAGSGWWYSEDQVALVDRWPASCLPSVTDDGVHCRDGRAASASHRGADAPVPDRTW